jgi:non-heme chloroperoxidase
MAGFAWMQSGLTQTKHIQLHDGQKMPVLVIGRGQPVIMLHGFGMDARIWLPFILPFMGQYQFYLPFLRGFGKATRVRFSQPDFMADYVADVQAMRQQLGLDRVLLAGISMGAMTSLYLHRAGGFDGVLRYLHIDQSPVFYHSEDWPYGVFGAQQVEVLTQFRRLVEQATPHLHLRFDRVPTALQQQMYQVMGQFMAQAVHTPLQRAMFWPLVRWPQLMQNMIPVTGWQALIDGMRGYLEQRYDFRDTLPHMDVPVTVMSGAESRLYALEGQRRLALMLPNAQHVVIARAGHAPMLDQPLAFVRELGRFLRGR